VTGPLVSVIIPAYNGGDLIGEAIRSVLGQTHRHLELIVVDDVSSDNTADVIRGFGDPRLRYIRHDTNRGACAARRTGLGESSGDIIAFLDQDDLFCPDKLARHVAFLQEHPETGFTYNPHFTLSHPSGRILGVSRPPENLSLADLVVGFPLPPSAWVLRRDWACREELWDPSTYRRGREVVFCGRLFVAGCRFSLLDGALHYRRVEVERRFSDPAAKCREECSCQDIMLDEARCPPSVRAVRHKARAAFHLMWATVAFVQDETGVGQDLLRGAAELDPTLFQGEPCPAEESFLDHVALVSADPEGRLRAVFGQLPAELSSMSARADRAAGRLRLVQVAQHVLWGNAQEAASHLARAVELKAQIDDGLLLRMTAELLDCCDIAGPERALTALGELGARFRRLGGRQAERRLTGAYHLARAFRLHGRGNPTGVPGGVLRAFFSDPQSAANRGAWSILAQALGTPARHADPSGGRR
jgi:hypothetical protein